MTNLDELKNQLGVAKQKFKEKRKKGSSPRLLSWYEGYTDGLERAIDIMEEEEHGNH